MYFFLSVTFSSKEKMKRLPINARNYFVFEREKKHVFKIRKKIVCIIRLKNIKMRSYFIIHIINK